MKMVARIASFLPGIALSVFVALIATRAEHLEVSMFGQRWLESLVLAILIGMGICTVTPPSNRFKLGIHFSAKTLLEIAIVMLGASISVSVLRNLGLGLVVGIMMVVMVTLPMSYFIGRALGLSRTLATLVACGNSICGNSAIAAAAPVIGANSDEVATSIAFTAMLGIGVVLVLPLIQSLFHMHSVPYGVLAGLTVYAVPQVLAATASAGIASIHIGTFVKLIRVLMLGPIIFMLGLMQGKESSQRPRLHHMLPWFILGFLGMMALRSLSLIPEQIIPTLSMLSNNLTIVAMAALGLTVNARTIADASGRVVATASLSIILLAAFGIGLIRLLQIT